MHRLHVCSVLCLALIPVSAAFLHAGAANARVTMQLAGREDPEQWVHLAQQYDQAQGVEESYAKANELYCRAARGGNAEAQFRLGWIYATGRGVTRDTGVASALFTMAAEQGHEYARRRLQQFPPRPDTQLPSCLLPARVKVDMEARPEVDTKARREVETLVQRLAPQYAIDPQLVMAVISVESGFNPSAVSPKKAQGLMQLIPETAQRFGVKRVFDPAENIAGGLAYLQWLMAFFQGDVKLVLAAYNAGERAVERYRGIPPYEETQDYVRRITSAYRKQTHPYSTAVAAPSPVMRSLRKGN